MRWISAKIAAFSCSYLQHVPVCSGGNAFDETNYSERRDCDDSSDDAAALELWQSLGLRNRGFMS